MIKKWWSDLEINGRIYYQFCQLSPDALLRDVREEVLEYCADVMQKLTATKYHLQNYIRIEEEQFIRCCEMFKKNPNQIEEAFELVFELEAFLFQIKSSLDMLVKLMIPIVGRGMVKTATYANKGDDLVKGLEQYKKMKNVNIQAIDNLISLVKADKQDWIEKVIDVRDRLNHKKALSNYHFQPVKETNGEITASRPRFDGTSTVEFMNKVYNNNIQFHQDFMVFALALKLPKGLTLMSISPESVKVDPQNPYKQFVKWGWGFSKPPENT